jgi:hypothetical protein
MQDKLVIIGGEHDTVKIILPVKLVLVEVIKVNRTRS